MIVRLVFGFVFCALLAGCGGGAVSVWASDEDVARAMYRHDGPPTLTLFTVINNRSNAGAHSALMVNSSHRAIFDPAGSWYHPHLPERNDVHFGMTDRAVDFYVDYHSRITYRTVIQTIVVSEAVAQLAMEQILAQGAAPKAQCSTSVTSILSRLPGFESIGYTWFPNKLMESFGKLPGVTTEVVYDNDPDKNTGFVVAEGI